jgi:hypothetical protein
MPTCMESTACPCNRSERMQDPQPFTSENPPKVSNANALLCKQHKASLLLHRAVLRTRKASLHLPRWKPHRPLCTCNNIFLVLLFNVTHRAPVTSSSKHWFRPTPLAHAKRTHQHHSSCTKAATTCHVQISHAYATCNCLSLCDCQPHLLLMQQILASTWHPSNLYRSYAQTKKTCMHTACKRQCAQSKVPSCVTHNNTGSDRGCSAKTRKESTEYQ